MKYPQNWILRFTAQFLAYQGRALMQKLHNPRARVLSVCATDAFSVMSPWCRANEVCSTIFTFFIVFYSVLLELR